MKKVLIIGLGEQGKKYINYFIKNNYQVFGVCKTENTKKNIISKYNIEVSIDYLDKNFNSFDIIIISVPPDIQGEISLDILKKGFDNKLIIEIPVTWIKEDLEEIKKYKNAFFFLEEYYTLMAYFLRKIDIKKIERININIITNKDDYNNLEARKVSYIHVNNNFLLTAIDFKKIIYNFEFHNIKDIFYEIYLEYNGIIITYIFNKEKFIKIGDKKIVDNYNFDNVLSYILKETTNFNKYYNINE